MTTAPARPALTVRVPMVPASCLLPNAQRRTSHHVWGPAAAELRETTWHHAAAVSPPGAPGWHGFTRPVFIRTVIAWPKGRRGCDFQAAVHALKAAIDGLQGLFFLDDRQVVGMDIVQRRADPEDRSGWMTLTVMAGEEETP